MNLEVVLDEVPGVSEVVSVNGITSISSLRETGFRGARTLPATVVLCVEDICNFLQGIFVLDSVVENLVILSSSLSETDFLRLVQQFDSPIVVTDKFEVKNAYTCEELLETHQADSARVATRWILATSGTTAAPKLVSHSLQSLTKTVKNKKSLSDLRWGLLYDPARFAGLQVVLQAVGSGSCLVAPPGSESLAKRVSFLKRNGVNALSATPTLWKKILLSKLADDWPMVILTLGGEIAEQRVLDALVAKFPDAGIRHIYASTEAGTGFSVFDKTAGFPSSFIDNPPSGMELKVEDNRLFVKNNQVQKRYVGTDNEIADEYGFIDTGDVVEKDGDRYLFRGRANGVINVGGNKVYPETVENILKEHHSVAFVRVRGAKSSIVGELVCAEVVLESEQNQEAKLQELREFASEKLEPYQRPVKYIFVEDIPHNENGKIVRS